MPLSIQAYLQDLLENFNVTFFNKSSFSKISSKLSLDVPSAVLSLEKITPPQSITEKSISNLSSFEQEFNLGEISHLNSSNIIEQELLQASKIETEFENFFIALESLEKEYDQVDGQFNQLGKIQTQVLVALEYLKMNRKGLLGILKSVLPNEHFSTAKQILDVSKETYKWGNCTGPFFLYAIQILIANETQKRLEELQIHFHVLKSKGCSSKISTHELQKRLKTLSEKVNLDIDEAQTKGGIKFGKVASKITVFSLRQGTVFNSKTINKVCKLFLGIIQYICSLLKLKKTLKIQNEWLFNLKPIEIKLQPNFPFDAQEALFFEAENFLESFNCCVSLDEVKNNLDKVGVTLSTPVTLDLWQEQFSNTRFRRQLVQAYYYTFGKKFFLHSQQVESLLSERAKRHAGKVEEALPIILEHFEKCQRADLNFDEIKTHFKKNHMHFENLKTSPASKEEFLTFCQSDAFCFALAAQWVDFQDTSAQLATQGVRQALLSKHTVEGKFLYFRVAEYAFLIATSLLQLILIPKATLLMTTCCLEGLIKTLSHFGLKGIGVLHVFSPIYPVVSFKSENIFLMTAEHLFGVYHKPNEYSFEGYKLCLQIQLIELTLVAKYCLSCLQHILLWIKMRLIENFRKGLDQKTYAEDPRRQELQLYYEQKKSQYEQKITDLKEQLYKKYLMDAKLNLHPQSSENKQFDPLQNLSDALKETDFNFFPENSRHFFEEHLGMKITESNKEQLDSHLNSYFIACEADFVGQYHKNRFKYLDVS